MKIRVALLETECGGCTLAPHYYTHALTRKKVANFEFSFTTSMRADIQNLSLHENCGSRSKRANNAPLGYLVFKKMFSLLGVEIDELIFFTNHAMALLVESQHKWTSCEFFSFLVENWLEEITG